MPEAVGKPPHRQRAQSEGKEGARGESDEFGVAQAGLRSDSDNGSRVDQQHEVVEGVRDVDEQQRTAGKVFRAHVGLRNKTSA